MGKLIKVKVKKPRNKFGADIKVIPPPKRKKVKRIVGQSDDGTIVMPEGKKKLFGGGERSFEMVCKMYDFFKIPYTVVQSGGSSEIHANGRVRRFVTNKQDIKGVGAACLRVLNDVRKFEERVGTLEVPYRTTFYKNAGLFTDYLMKDGREVVEVDIKACYWTVAFNSGIISEETYNKYEDSKELRLIAIGNTNKSTITTKKRGGQNIGEHAIEKNFHRWVWNYVVYKAYEIFEKANAKTKKNVFLFRTDGIYVAPEHEETVKQVISKMGFEFRVTKWKVIGHHKRRIVMKNRKGKKKLTHFGCPDAVKTILPYVEMDIKEYNEEIKVEKQELAIQPATLGKLTPNKEF